MRIRRRYQLHLARPAVRRERTVNRDDVRHHPVRLDNHPRAILLRDFSLQDERRIGHERDITAQVAHRAVRKTHGSQEEVGIELRKIEPEFYLPELLR